MKRVVAMPSTLDRPLKPFGLRLSLAPIRGKSLQTAVQMARSAHLKSGSGRAFAKRHFGAEAVD